MLTSNLFFTPKFLFTHSPPYYLSTEVKLIMFPKVSPNTLLRVLVSLENFRIAVVNCEGKDKRV